MAPAVGSLLLLLSSSLEKPLNESSLYFGGEEEISISWLASNWQKEAFLIAKEEVEDESSWLWVANWAGSPAVVLGSWSAATSDDELDSKPPVNPLTKFSAIWAALHLAWAFWACSPETEICSLAQSWHSFEDTK